MRVGKGPAKFGMRIRHLRAAAEQTVMDRRGMIQGDICAGYAFGASAYMEWIEYLNSLDWMRSLWKCVGRVEDLGQSPGALQYWSIGEVGRNCKEIAAIQVGREPGECGFKKLDEALQTKERADQLGKTLCLSQLR